MNIVIGGNTPEDKNNSDFITYRDSLIHLADNLLRERKNNPYFIVLSRKGPRLIEMLLSEDERKDMNILSEHALPFLFSSLNKEKNKKYRIVIIDDAIYYGSTIENLVSEVNEYAKVYGVLINVVIYSAIKVKESKDISGIQIYAKNDVPKGFGHYFVNLLMSDIRSMGVCMEVEFPIVTYKLKNKIAIRELQSNLKKIYEKRGRLYDVRQYSSTSFHEIGDGRFSILLESDKGASYSKMRFYVNSDNIRVAFISPHVLPNNTSVIGSIFDNRTDIVKKTWESITEIINNLEVQGPYGSIMSRNRQRTIVVIANYLLSLNIFFREDNNLRRIISVLSNSNSVESSFDDLQLKYIFYDDAIIQNIKSIIKECQNDVDKYFSNIIPYNQHPSKHQIFESTGYPSEQEKEILQDFNTWMLNKSSNLNEKLSVLFFNQTTLIEKKSRMFGESKANRLHFGYNYDGLYAAVSSTSFRSTEITSFKDYNLVCIHRWVDRRIDQGCIVPQYIIDYEKNQWDRVFRPGENEEAIISPLTRFVAFVIKSVKKIFGLHVINEFIFKKILCVVVNDSPNFQDLLHIKLIITEKGLLFCGEDDDLKSDDRHDVVEYLKDLLILENISGYIDISKRFVETEQVINTAFSSNIRKSIEATIKSFQKELETNNINFAYSYSVCNYLLRNCFSTTCILNSIAKCVEALSKSIELLMVKRKRQDDDDAREYINEAFSITRLFIISRPYYDKYISILPINSRYNQVVFYRISFVSNILLLLFYSRGSNLLRAYIDMIDDDFAQQIGVDDIISEIKTALENPKFDIKTLTAQQRMKRLQAYINRIKEIDE